MQYQVFLLLHRQRVRVLRGLAGQVVIRRGQGGDLDAADRPLTPDERLRLRQLNKHAAVGVVAAGDDAAHRDVARDPLAGERERVADGQPVRASVGRPHDRSVRVIVGRPRALQPPPSAEPIQARLDALAGGQLEVVAEPGAGRGHVLATRVGRGHVQQRREVVDVVGPKDRLDVAQLVLTQVRAGLGGLARVVEVIEDGRALGTHDDVRAVGLEFLVDLIAHVEHDGEHGRGHAGAQRDGQGDHQVAVAALVRAPRSIRKNMRTPYFAKTEAEASSAEIGTVSVPLETL